MKKLRRIVIIAAEVLLLCLLLLVLVTNPGKSGWHSIAGRNLYYTDNSGLARGYTLISGEPYFFGKTGLPRSEGWIQTDDGNDFYCCGGGKLATGWKYMDSKAYYFFKASDKTRKAGAQAKDYLTSGGIRVPEKGYLEGDEALAIAYAIDVLNRYGWDLESAYKYSAALGFISDSEETYGFRIHKCAIQGFKYGKGTCLAWAGTFCAMAKVMGYDCRLVWGTLPFRGENVPHGWAEIWEEDGIHVYDPRKNDGKDMEGFDRRYREPGTRMYNEDSKQYMDW